MGPEALPFFIQWDVPASQHPGRDPAPHRNAPSGIQWVEIGGDPAQLARWLGDALPGLRVVPGAPGVRALAIRTEAGEVVLRG
jgi:hypothetical protein